MFNTDLLIEFFNNETSIHGIRALIILVVGIIVARASRRGISRISQKHLDEHQIMLARQGVYYCVLILFLISALREIGFNLNVLLGAAGILTFAVGFASQTAVSNLISGLFMIGERPFSVGDVIKFGDTMGVVLSIDLLSVKLRTFNNLFVRIPNEALIKSEVINYSRFPIRRLDLNFGVAYKESIDDIRQLLSEIADKNHLCLEEPRPLFIFEGFGDSALNIQFSVWASKHNYLDLRNSILLEIHNAFNKANIEIPYPQRTIHIDNIEQLYSKNKKTIQT